MIDESTLFEGDTAGGWLDCEGWPGKSAGVWSGLEAIEAINVDGQGGNG
jgi:hypothetical protein